MNLIFDINTGKLGCSRGQPVSHRQVLAEIVQKQLNLVQIASQSIAAEVKQALVGTKQQCLQFGLQACSLSAYIPATMLHIGLFFVKEDIGIAHL